VTRRPGGDLSVEMNTGTLPRVLVNNRYAAELRSGDATARAYIAECRTNGGWLVRALEQRARTILKVASDVVAHQERFFTVGAAELRPLTQRTVADRVGLHESTISRVAAGKFILCQQGTFEMRYFFSSSIQSVAGGEAFSAVAVQKRIRDLVDAEAARRPLSDDKLVAALRSSGIDIARRTVAKYREVMGIPSSVERRRRQGTLPDSLPVSAQEGRGGGG
jgi:RNA polymerase sigma-54 factor